MSVARPLIDSHGRALQDLRISVTDRCNFRCLYCLPETEAALNFYRGRWATLPNPAPIIHAWQPKEHLLTFEEITRLVRILVPRGIRKIRLTGGEPLLRRGIANLVQMLTGIPGIEDIALTTNGFLFPLQGRALKEAGLHRISFSLDSLRADRFLKMTGRNGLTEVLDSIRMARELGLNPVKVNAVIIRGMNDDELDDLAGFARSEGLAMRFIEFMPLDSARAWQKDYVVPGREILEKLSHLKLVPVKSTHAAETARRWKFPDSPGEIGIIAPVSEPFCGHCNRLRLTSDGKMRTCLFSMEEHDLRKGLREGMTDADLESMLERIVFQKEAGHRIGQADFKPPERSMSCIGG